MDVYTYRITNQRVTLMTMKNNGYARAVWSLAIEKQQEIKH